MSGHGNAPRGAVAGQHGRAVRVFAPGRTEIAGNHTDHQHGRVIAAAVEEGIEFLVHAAPDGGDAGESRLARVESPGHAPVELDLAAPDALAPHPRERGSSAALVRGVVAGLVARGVPVRGFAARTESTIPAGAGLSSSAAFEVGLARALDLLFGDGSLNPACLAAIGQAAERDFYGKPCGLMDQMASALGGVQLMDFADPAAPVTESLDADFEGAGYRLYLVGTGTAHADLEELYAQIPADMHAVAERFGHEVLREVPETAFLGELDDLRAELGDRPVLRAIHFYNEMRLVDARANALRARDMGRFLQLTRLSATSSAQYLQNVSVPGSARQPMMVALALVDDLLGLKGAARVHGGGFGGCIQAYVPEGIADVFALTVDQLLGEGAAHEVRIRPTGVMGGPETSENVQK